MPKETSHLLVISNDYDLVQSISGPLGAAGYALHWLTRVSSPSLHVFVQNVQAVVFDLESDSSSEAPSLAHLLQIAKCKVLVITAAGSMGQRITALRAGASVVVSRPVQREELIACLSLLDSAPPVDHPAFAFFFAPGVIIDSENSVIAGEDYMIGLTVHEMLVLRVLAQSANRIVGYHLLCGVLGLAPDRQGILALRQAVARLRRKLSSQFCALQIVAERQRGYSLLAHENAGNAAPVQPQQSNGLPRLGAVGTAPVLFG